VLGKAHGHESQVPPSQNDGKPHELLIDLRTEADQILKATGLFREGPLMRFEVRISARGNVDLKIGELYPVKGIDRDEFALLPDT